MREKSRMGAAFLRERWSENGRRKSLKCDARGMPDYTMLTDRLSQPVLLPDLAEAFQRAVEVLRRVCG